MKARRQQLIYLFCTNFLFFMGVNSMNILPAYLASHEAGSGIVGLFNTVPILVLVVLVFFQLFRGRTLHKLKMIRIGFICNITAMAGMILFRGRLPVMFAFYLLTGITYAAGFTNLFSMMYDLVPREKWRSSAALFGISGLMTSGIASLLSQGVYRNFPDYSIFFIPAVCSFIAIILTLFLNPRFFTLVEKEAFSLGKFRSSEGIKPLILQALIFGGGFGVFKTFMPLMTLSRLGEVDITRFFGFFTLIGISYRLGFSRWIDRFSRKFIMGIGYLLMIAGLIFMTRIQNLGQLYLIGAGYGLAHSLLFPTFSAEFVRLGGEDRAAYNNIYLALFTTGLTGFSSGLGILGDYRGIGSIPLVMSAIVALGFLSLFGRKGNSTELA